MKSLNVTIIVQTLLSGGAEKQSVFLAKVLSKEYNVSLIVLKGNQIEPKFLEMLHGENVSLIKLKGNAIVKFWKIYNHFKRTKTNISFSYLASSNFFNAFAGIIAGVKYRIGGIRSSKLSSKKIAFERLFHNHINTKTITNNYSAVEGLSKVGFRRDKFHVIHNAFDLQQVLIPKGIKRTINIISVGRFVPPKDYDTALKAINVLKSKLIYTDCNFKYILIGYGVLESKIRKKIEELNLIKSVDIVVKPDNLDAYFKNADIYLTTSLFEGLSNSVMEALSFSLPVVATPAGDMQYLVKEDINGYICDIGDYNQISNRLVNLVSNNDLRKAMGEKSYQIISENFSMDRFKNNYITFIDNLK